VAEENKAIVCRLVDEVFNGGRLDVIDELYAPELAGAARRWIAPFRASFPDVHMEIVELIAEDDKVAGRFTCSATWETGMFRPGVPEPSSATALLRWNRVRAWSVVRLASLWLSRTTSWTWRLVPPTSRPPALFTSSTAFW
jgi:hypothetical protein